MIGSNAVANAVPMMARLIDGRAASAEIRAALKQRVDALPAVPVLAVVLVGENPASAVYVRSKIAACRAIGLASRQIDLPACVDTSAILAHLAELNADPAVCGILVQLPLPQHVDAQRVIEAIAPDKDVDGFHPYNAGALAIGHCALPPCTPNGVIRLLEREGVPIAGANAVVVGASNIVGKPMGAMLLQRGATVSICHVGTRDLAQFTVLADILVVAAGHPNLITAPMVRRGAVVIDVGINRLPNGQLVGDVEFDAVRRRASLITPVPGGVGPMTVAMLLENSVRSAERRFAGADA